MYLGIDVSNNNGHIVWPQVAVAGVTHAAIKASEGSVFHDAFYDINVRSARDAGLLTAAYHFGRPFANSGRAEAQYFLETCSHSPSPRRYVLDLEDERGDPTADLAEYAINFLETVAVETGTVPILYTSFGYARAHKLVGNCELAPYRLWLASWQSLEPGSFAPFPEWDGWQFTASGYTPGVGEVDQSLWRSEWLIE